MCFVHNGVAHIWDTTADWHEELTDALEDFLVQLDETTGGQVQAQVQVERDAQAERARVEEMAGALQDLPAFRSANNATIRRRLASRQFPADEDDHTHSFLVSRAMKQAHTVVQHAAEEVNANYENRLEEIADELLASGILDQATGAASRKIKVRDFLIESSGGYLPTSRMLTLLLDLPQLKAGKRKPSRAEDEVQLPLT